LTGGSNISGNIFNKAYAENPGNPALNLAPAPGGGASGNLGSGPANFGFQAWFSVVGQPAGIDGRGALRDVAVDVTQSTPLSSTPLTGPAGNQSFVTSGNLSFVLASATYDYNYPSSVILGKTLQEVLGSEAIGSNTLQPTSGGAAHLTSLDLGGGLTLLRLSIPIQATVASSIPDNLTVNTSFIFTGSIAAYAIVPEPSSMVLGLFAAAGLAAVPIRNRRPK
jgi:hypothetical protein